MDLVLPSVIGGLGVACLLIALLADVWRWRRRSRRCCPGPRRSWRGWLTGRWIVYRERCDYDLSAHLPSALNASSRARVSRRPLVEPITCPECGRVVRRTSDLVRRAGPWRPGGAGLLLLAIATYTHLRPPVDAASLVAMASTDVLLSGESTLGATTPMEIRDELRRRAMDHRLTEEEVVRFVELLVRDLRDDHLVGNAKDAMAKLAIFGTFDADPLYRALASEDRQQRRLVREILRELPRTGEPPLELLRASIEDLKDDDCAWNLRTSWAFLREHIERSTPLLIEALDSPDDQERRAVEGLLRNAAVPSEIRQRLYRSSVADLASDRGSSKAWSAFRFLREHSAECEALLSEAMNASDGRTRLLAAAAAGCTNRSALMNQAVPILVRHLGDNRIHGDAVVAARSLWGFGPAVVPLLTAELRAAPQDAGNEQRFQSLKYLLARLTTDRPIGSLQRELPLSRLTLADKDALVLDPDELPMPWGADSE